MKVESSKVPPGEEDTLKLANKEVSKIKEKPTHTVKDGHQLGIE